MKSMNGKKFVFLFVLLMVVSGIAFSWMIKHSYDTRPLIKIDTQKSSADATPSSAAVSADSTAPTETK